MKKLKCECGGVYEKSQTVVSGILIDCQRCNKCGDVVISEKAAKDILRVKELREGISSERKIIKVGDSLGITLPKGIEKIGLKLGHKVRIEPMSSKAIKIAVK